MIFAALSLIAPFVITAAEPKLVSAGAVLTEIVFALGENSRLLAVDTTSSFPETAPRLPKLGYLRRLGAEGVLALRPGLVLASSEAGPPEALKHIEGAGVRVETVAAPFSPAGVAEKISQVSQILNVEGAGEALAARFNRDWTAAAAEIAALPGRRGCCSCSPTAAEHCRSPAVAPPPTP